MGAELASIASRERGPPAPRTGGNGISSSSDDRLFERVRLGGEVAKAAPGRVGRAPVCVLPCAVPLGNREIIKCTLPEMLSNVTILPSRPGLGILLRGAVTTAY